MTVKEVNIKEEWEGFLLKCKDKTFVNSWSWGEFQKKEGEKIWRLGIYMNNDMVGVALVIKVKARRGTFLFVPHGPNTIDEGKRSEVLTILMNRLKEIAKEESALFVRVAPIWERNEKNIEIFKSLRFKKAPTHMHPEVTWELDITPSEEDLMKNMRKTTRYLVRQADKNEVVEISISTNISNLKDFEEIYAETVKRHHFAPFSPKYLENQFNSFSLDSQIIILLGKLKGEVISSAIVVFWQGGAYYHHGASTSNQKVPISYLLQWTAIKEAKKRNCLSYNFWGIAEEIKNKDDIKKSKHPWAGLTLFKMGFGGARKEYVKTQDLPISARYYLTYIFEKLRKIKRGL